MAKRNVTSNPASAIDFADLRVKVLQARSTAKLMGLLPDTDVPIGTHSWAADSVWDLLTAVADNLEAAEVSQ